MSENTIEHGDETEGAEDELQEPQLGKGYGADEGELLEPLSDEALKTGEEDAQ